MAEQSPKCPDLAGACRQKAGNQMDKIERNCEVCNKHFKPMTDKQWENVRDRLHPISERHNAYLKLKQSGQ